MSPEDPRHGTNAGYAYGGCREECCRRAHALRMNLWRMGRTDSLIPALGTHRRIEALMTLGWSRAQMSLMLGHQRDYLTKLRSKVRVTDTTAAKVDALFARLCMTPAPTTASASKVRQYAARHGYAPPLAWDDIDTDPRPKGVGSSPRNYRGSLAAEWAHLREAGVSIHQAAQQLGVTVGAIEKALERAKGSAA